jgi:hypothetical protein
MGIPGNPLVSAVSTGQRRLADPFHRLFGRLQIEMVLTANFGTAGA